MKIAVASADGTAIAQHFGRSACFIVFEVEQGKILGREVRTNSHSHAAHEGGNCQGNEPHSEQPHSHALLANILRDCAFVLCGGMGWRAAQELGQHGIQPLMVPAEIPPEAAVMAFLEGKLQPASQGFCRCHH